MNLVGHIAQISANKICQVVMHFLQDFQKSINQNLGER